MAWQNRRPKHVPTPVREACLARDGHQCVALLNTGDRCPERDPSKLQAAHLTRWRP